MEIPKKCNICPRKCNIDRNMELGRCLGGSKIKIASVSPHYGEEECLSGYRGSGTVFFSGCNLGCVFCQNHRLRDSKEGKFMTNYQLADIFNRLEGIRVHNINLVTPTHYRPWIQEAISIAKEDGFSLPIVWNTGGYETVESIEALDGDIDVYLYDMKFYDSDLSNRLANAPDYFEYAIKGLETAYKQVGKPVFNSDGLIQKGVIVRLLVLPNYPQDAVKIIENIAKVIPSDKIVLSLMRQYSPPRGLRLPDEINRRLTNEEFEIPRKRAIELGFSKDYFQ